MTTDGDPGDTPPAVDAQVAADTEHELKFALGASMAAEFESRVDAGLSGDARRLRSCYYDTSAGDLLNAGIALRIRSVDGVHLQTLKAAGGPAGGDAADAFSRFEWERRVERPVPHADALPPVGHPVGDRVRECLSMLLPVFETDFERMTRQVLPMGTARVELALDRGEIRTGQAREAIDEVELERKGGSAAIFYRYALQWARLHDARLLLASKHERGLRLAGWRTTHAEPTRCAPRAPVGGTPVAQAARAVLHGHLQHFLANLPAVLETARPEGPHQMRVALRRLRASIRFFDLREDPSGDGDTPWRSLDRMARSIANAAGFVRDADVFESRLLGELERSFPRDAALRVLAHSLAEERERARAQLRATLGAPSTTEFILLALAAIEAIEPGRFDAPDFRRFAAARIATLVRKARRRAGAAVDESDWHETRIAIKNLRYALDSCTALELTREPAARVLARLGDWQDALGEGQDLAVARSTASQALGRAAAPIEMSVRCIALIDGYRAFVTARTAPPKLAQRIRAQLKSMFATDRSAKAFATATDDASAPSRKRRPASVTPATAVAAAPASTRAAAPPNDAAPPPQAPAPRRTPSPPQDPLPPHHVSPPRDPSPTRDRFPPQDAAASRPDTPLADEVASPRRASAPSSAPAPRGARGRAAPRDAKPRSVRRAPTADEGVGDKRAKARPVAGPSDRGRAPRAPGSTTPGSTTAGATGPAAAPGNRRPTARPARATGKRGDARVVAATAKRASATTARAARAAEPEPAVATSGAGTPPSTASLIASMAATLAAEVDAALAQPTVPTEGVGQSGSGADAFGDNTGTKAGRSRAGRR
ncbi:MAG: CHAD domain-containing protein [Lautropia sp.]